MAGFGEVFRITTFGESHGQAIGVVVEGVTPGLEIDEQEIQKQLDRRKPGQSEIVTQRKESDTVQIVSGVFEGKATGAPLTMLIHNEDQRPGAYESIKDQFRPGHADYTYFHKYGFRDWRGSGRASGRETAARVAAGAIALKILSAQGVQVRAFVRQIGSIRAESVDYEQIEQNIVRAPNQQVAVKMIELIKQCRADQDSVGGIIECHVSGCPVGWGEPVFDKLDADLAKAIVSIGAIKGIEFGSGFASVDMRGSEHNDEMDRTGFLSNHAGGILGGLSSGADIVFRAAVKPTSSIAREQRTLNEAGQEVTISTRGRHDPCITPRAVPVVEAMTALVLVDHCKRHAALLK